MIGYVLHFADIDWWALLYIGLWRGKKVDCGTFCVTISIEQSVNTKLIVVPDIANANSKVAVSYKKTGWRRNGRDADPESARRAQIHAGWASCVL